MTAENLKLCVNIECREAHDKLCAEIVALLQPQEAKRAKRVRERSAWMRENAAVCAASKDLLQ